MIAAMADQVVLCRDACQATVYQFDILYIGIC